MRIAALALDVVFVLTAFGVRTALQRRRTGDSGWRLGRPHSRAEAFARILLFGWGVLLIVAVALAAPPSGATWSIAGFVVAAAAILLVVLAQLQMGASWRIGVDPSEHTALVVLGVYSQVRNPIYTGMIAFAVGQAMMLPSIWSFAAVATILLGTEVQVRAVEEPYLRSTHGSAFSAWASRAGRFLPGVGRSRTDATNVS